MSKRVFRINLMGSAVIELDDEVISVVNDEWRKNFYRLVTVNDIAGHIGYNLIVNGVSLSQLDGWADQSDEDAILLRPTEWEIDECREM